MALREGERSISVPVTDALDEELKKAAAQELRSKGRMATWILEQWFADRQRSEVRDLAAERKEAKREAVPA